MSSAQERDAFSQRLRLSLDRAGWRGIGATALAREFNRRSAGHPVTAHATRKWLHGEAIPAQNNLRELAGWLAVPAQWLRFGESLLPGPADTPHKVSEPMPNPYLPERAARLAADLVHLSAEQLRVVEALVELLLKTQERPLRDC